MPTSRNPYPSPRLENDDDFRLDRRFKRPIQAGSVSKFHDEEPWRRLAERETVCSSLKSGQRSKSAGPARKTSRFRVTSFQVFSGDVTDDRSAWLKQVDRQVTDHLDLLLSAQYDHHSQFPAGVCDVLLQPDTVTKCPHKRLTRAQSGTGRKQGSARDLNPYTVVHTSPRRETIDSVPLAIECPHTSQTNKGYKRKPDGGFFTT